MLTWTPKNPLKPVLTVNYKKKLDKYTPVPDSVVMSAQTENTHTAQDNSNETPV